MRFIYLSMIALVAISCSQSKMLQDSLKKYNTPIGYLHDSKITDCPRTDSLIVRLNFTPLDTITTVTKTKGLYLPLILFYYHEVDMKVRLGQNSIQQMYDEFFFNSVIDESKRTGCFAVSKQESNDSLYTLEITIDTCVTYSNYQNTNTVFVSPFGYFINFHEMGFPAETNLQVATRLTRGNLIIAEKSYIIKKTQPFLSTFSEGTDKLRADFTANMVESLSLSTKECIEDIICDVNDLISAKPSDVSGKNLVAPTDTLLQTQTKN